MIRGGEDGVVERPDEGVEPVGVALAAIARDGHAGHLLLQGGEIRALEVERIRRMLRNRVSVGGRRRSEEDELRLRIEALSRALEECRKARPGGEPGR